MKLQKKTRIAMVMTLALLIASCSSKQNQAGQADAAESTDSTAVDSADAVVTEQYDLEAIAKAIEGCESLDKFRGGVARVTMKDERFYIDLQGRRVEKPKEEADPTELTCDYEDGKFSDGMAIPYQYGTMAESDGNDFHEGLCAVIVNDEHEWFSYIDQSGKMVIELPDGWWGRKFMDGVAQIQKIDSCYIIDKTGQRLFRVNNEEIYTGDDIRYSEGLAVVYGKGKYEKKRGFMDKTGRITFCLGKDE